MSLLCHECDSVLTSNYQIFVFLGHTKTGLVKPEESLSRGVLCGVHRRILNEKIDPSSLTEDTIDDLVFTLVPGIPAPGGNFNGAYAIDQAYSLTRNGYFDQPSYVLGGHVARCLPNALTSLIKELSNPKTDPFYKAAVDEYAKRPKYYPPSLTKEQKERQEKILHEIKLNKQLIFNNSNLFRSTIEDVLLNRQVDASVVKQLKESGILEPTSDFRRYSHLPGEAYLFHYEFEPEQTDQQGKAGFLGFDDNLELISIDERSPAEKLLYRKGTIEKPDWVTIG